MAFRIRGIVLLGACLSLAALLLAGTTARAADKKENSAVKPSIKDENRHKGFVAIAKKGNIDVVFFGDSITDGWRGRGQDVWKERYGTLHAANFGIGGDRTQHVLWRLQNGELDGYTPKVAVVMIGTNNLGSNTDDEIADGIKAVVAEIKKQQPKTKILLLGIFPRGSSPRTRIATASRTSTRSFPSSTTTARRSSTWTSAANSWRRTAPCPRTSCRTSCTRPRRATRSGRRPSTSR